MFCGPLVGDREVNESGLGTAPPKLPVLLCSLDHRGPFQQDLGHTAAEPCPRGLCEGGKVARVPRQDL